MHYESLTLVYNPFSTSNNDQTNVFKMESFLLLLFFFVPWHFQMDLLTTEAVNVSRGRSHSKGQKINNGGTCFWVSWPSCDSVLKYKHASSPFDTSKYGFSYISQQ